MLPVIQGEVQQFIIKSNPKIYIQEGNSRNKEPFRGQSAVRMR